MTQLDAINKMLRYVGEIPVPDTVIIDDLPDGHEAKTAKIILTEQNRELQESGWWFNIEDWEYPGEASYITIPVTVISLKATTGTDIYLVKGNQLYSVTDQTKIFTNDITLTTTFEVDFTETPSSFSSYVVYNASKHLHTYLNGDSGVQKELDKLIDKQMIKVEKEHMSNRNYNAIRGSRIIDRTTIPTALI